MSTPPCRRVRVTGTVEIALPVAQAFLLFTPTGERAWARGWDPVFPSPGADETEPGTVFRTVHAAQDSLWTVVRCEFGRSIAYTVATPQRRCGLVTVTCESSATGTTATVSYDLTALDSRANSDLEKFAANYAEFLAHWQDAIADTLASATRLPPRTKHSS